MWRSITAAFVGLLALAPLSPGAVALAQEEVPARAEEYVWLGAGLGVGSEDFAGSANLSLQLGPHLFSLRVAGTAGLFDDGFGDVALLYGRATRDVESRYRAGLALGIAAADGCETPGAGALFSTCEDRRTVVGLPIEAQLVWLPAEFLGIGLYGFADLNRNRSFAGLTLTLQFGDVR